MRRLFSTSVELSYENKQGLHIVADRPPCRLGRDRRHRAASPPHSVRSLAPLDEGFEAVVVVGQGLGEGEELGDGVFGAGDAHLDSVAADRDAGGQAGEPAVEGGHGDRDADPGAAGLAKCGPHLVAAGGFIPEGGVLLEPPELAEELGAGKGADGAGPFGPEGPHQGGRPGARDAEERFEVAADEQRPVERLELRDGVGEGEEPPGASGHRTDRATSSGRVGWGEGVTSCLTLC